MISFQLLFVGETTPPRVAPSLPPFYNSMRSMKAPHSEVGSYFFAQQVWILFQLCLFNNGLSKILLH